MKTKASSKNTKARNPNRALESLDQAALQTVGGGRRGDVTTYASTEYDFTGSR